MLTASCSKALVCSTSTILSATTRSFPRSSGTRRTLWGSRKIDPDGSADKKLPVVRKDTVPSVEEEIEKNWALATQSTYRQTLSDWFHFLSFPGFFQSEKRRREIELDEYAIQIYRQYGSHLDHMNFVERYKVPDNFLTWIKITMLHNWLVLVRVSEDMSDSDYLAFKDSLNAAFINDYRKKATDIQTKFKVGRLLTKKNNDSFDYLYMRTILEYDFALLSDDRVLAGALWRCFYDSSYDVDVVALSKLVRYVRKQIRSMKRVPIDSILKNGFPNFADFAAANYSARTIRNTNNSQKQPSGNTKSE